MDLDRLVEHLDIGENKNIEFKAAAGGLPKDMWKTVSAFANTDGGYIFLGVSEKNGNIVISGVDKPNEQLKNFWNSHNNNEKLSKPICSDSDIEIKEIETKKLIIIKVPRATRTQRPVYINNNPMIGTYKRNFEGDYRCSEDEVKRMLRDASDEPQDLEILAGFNLEDLDPDTLKSFRQRFSSRAPDRPWLALEDLDLLLQLGGWRGDRTTRKEGLTRAGLLMFGRERSILDAFPDYHLDYQEKLSENSEQRWTDRITLDGKWEPNLLNFYYLVYNRLVKDLEVPFKLAAEAIRKEETHVHEALREALVNTLIHADYISSRPLKIIKFTNYFLFSNPGRLRIPIKQLYEGGVSAPRNPNLQKMFQMLGLGEKAGSGFQKILRAWDEQQWREPLVKEDTELELTSVTLEMVRMIPKNVETELKEIVGNQYLNLTQLELTILVLAQKFERIRNIDIQKHTTKHSTEISKCLKGLVKNGYLNKLGRSSGTHYILADRKMLDSEISSEYSEISSEYSEISSEHSEISSEYSEISSEHSEISSEHSEISSEYSEISSEYSEISSEHSEISSEHSVTSSEHSEISSEHSEISSEHSEISSEHSEISSEHSEISSEHSEISSEHSENTNQLYEHLTEIAAPVRQKGRAEKELVKKVILKLCTSDYLSLRTLAELLGREPDSIRNHYVNQMLSDGLLQLKYPQQSNHPQQAYKTVDRVN